MALNELNLFFGPKLPKEFETVNLAFIAAPVMRADSAIGALSAIRYAKQNYNHIEEELTIFEEGTPNQRIEIEYDVPAISSTIANSGFIGGTSWRGDVVLNTETWGPKVLNSVIKVLGIHISPAGNWSPIIQPGLIWRPGYVLAASGLESSGSWLRRAIPEDGNDHKLILIYSVPETLYSTTATGNYNLVFPPSQAKYKTVNEIALAVEPHKIAYEGSIDVLQEIKINGSVKFSGTFTGVESDTFVRSIDRDTKRIDIKLAIGPDDLVELKYLTYGQYYVYTGFKAGSSWVPFDANPEYGHVIGDYENLSYLNSSTALLNQITLYALPTAAIKYTYTENTSGQTTLGTLKLRGYRALDYGETHFIRHIVSSEPFEDIDLRNDGTVINTWGYATFGRNFYDEQNQYGGDIFNNAVPSMIPLGRFVLGAPASVNSVSIADIRERGGGVPIDFPMIAVDSQEDGLDTLRGFLDLGIWEGKAIKEGGVVEIQVDQSLLKTDPDDTNPNTFLASEIYEIVRNQVPPGIDFIISYVEDL